MTRKFLLAAACLLIAGGPAHAEWQIARSRHFAVYSDEAPDAVEDLATRLERFDKAVRVALKLPDPDVGPSARVTVFVLPSLDEVKRIAGVKDVTDIYRSQSPAGPVVFFPRRTPNDQTRRTPSPLAVLQHEYAHHILYSGWGDGSIPTWLGEGLAEFFATARIRPDGGVILGAIPEYRWDGVDRANAFPAERLIRAAPDYGDEEQAQVFYGRSWLLIHYMIFDPDRAKRLDAYIAALKSGRSADDAASVLGVDAGLDQRLNSYGARPMMSAATLGPDLLAIGDVTIGALTPGEAAVMPVVMRARAGGDAAQTLALVRSLAAPFPTDAGAQNALAEAELDAGNDALAAAAADRALAADPGSVPAMIHKGMASMMAAEKAGNADPATWAAARRWFLAANKADPRDPWPARIFYDSFPSAKQAPSVAARKALLYAYALDPADMAVRWEAARLLLQDGNAASARIALEPIAFGEDGGTLALRARQVLTTLAATGPAAALIMIDATPSS